MGYDPVFTPIGHALWLTNQLISITLIAIFITIILIIITMATLVVVAFFYRKIRRSKSDEISVGFFHPYCNAGGGGERVLWVALRAMRKRFPSLNFVIFTGDVEAAPDQIVAKARQRFNLDIELDEKIQFVYLHRRRWVEADKYPFFTLLGQSIGSIFLGAEALSKYPVDLFIDTMGYAFTLPLFKYFNGSATACYVHYPTISTDMLQQVRSRNAAFNNREFIARSRIATMGKLLYYKFFAYLYGLCGSCSDVCMVNSSWTEEHIAALWHRTTPIRVYPPCDVKQFCQIKRTGDTEQRDVNTIVSLGQFRPEKDHPLQLRALAKVRDAIYEERGISEQEKDDKWKKIRLLLIGGVRNSEDESRVRDLVDLSKHLAIEDNVEVKVNLAFDDLKDEMGKALMGIHTMWNEHFGIAVVEMLASGLLTLAHRTGGPLMDIVVEAPPESRTGFLAITEEEYADNILRVVDMDETVRAGVRLRARSSVERFSEKEFESGWIRAVENLVNRVSG